MPFKFLSVFFALMMNLFPHPDCALILEHVLFHPHAAWCKLLRCSWAPVMETATQAATSNACQDKSPDRRASWLSVFLYLIQNYCNNLSLSHQILLNPHHSLHVDRSRLIKLQSQQLKQHPISADIIMTAWAGKITTSLRPSGDRHMKRRRCKNSHVFPPITPYSQISLVGTRWL